jgi:hypothetical protein
MTDPKEEEEQGKLRHMIVRSTLQGTTRLLMHNIRLSNPEDPYAKAMQKITAKRKKTEEDRRELARLEFFGGLYTAAEPGSEGHDHPDDRNDGLRVVMPQTNVKRMFKEAAKATRQGRNIDRALNYQDPVASERGVPLIFRDMDKSPAELWDIGKTESSPFGTYADMTMVQVSGRVLRCRPCFREWGIQCDWLIFPQLLDFETLRDIGEMAGLIEGLGDNRVNGCGRFKVKWEVLSV